MNLVAVVAFLVLASVCGNASPVNKVKVANPKRVTFSVIQSTDITSVSNQYEIIPFDTVLVNQPPGAYNPENGRFTAPLPGLYLLLSTCGSTDRSNVAISLFINGERVIHVIDTGTGHGHGTSSINTIRLLQKGDEVYIMRNAFPSDGLLGNSCTFSGFLL